MKLKIPEKSMFEIRKICEKYKKVFSELLDSDFKNAFPGIFNFTVGILTHTITHSYGRFNEFHSRKN